MVRQRAHRTLARSLHWRGGAVECRTAPSSDVRAGRSRCGTCGSLAAAGDLERRHVDQEQAPPGAAAEAAIAQCVELEGAPPAQTHAVEADEHARERQRGSLLTLSVAAAG